MDAWRSAGALLLHLADASEWPPPREWWLEGPALGRRAAQLDGELEGWDRDPGAWVDDDDAELAWCSRVLERRAGAPTYDEEPSAA